MKIKPLCLPLAICALLIVAAAVPVEEKETVRKQFSPTKPGAPMSLLIDNMWGGITVTTHARPDIEVVVEKKLVAPSETVAREFAQKVKLDISQTENNVRLYVDGPFRNDCGRRSRDWDMKDSRLVCDYRVIVPANARLDLKTVLDGDITVTGSAGEFDIQNVLGDAKLEAIRGFGQVSTVTGQLSANFDQVPGESCSFKTVSGKLRVSFPRTLSADLSFKTFQADVFTDFPVTSLPPVPVKREVKNGKFKYRVNEFYRVRVGQGGPELKFESLTGDIEIHDQSLGTRAER